MSGNYHDWDVDDKYDGSVDFPNDLETSTLYQRERDKPLRARFRRTMPVDKARKQIHRRAKYTFEKDDDDSIGKVLGSGSYAVIVKALWDSSEKRTKKYHGPETAKLVAVKVFQRDFDPFKNIEHSSASFVASRDQNSQAPVKTTRLLSTLSGIEGRSLTPAERDHYRTEARKAITKSFENEKDILKRIKATRLKKDVSERVGAINIVKFHETVETPLRYYITLQYAEGGDLWTYIEKTCAAKTKANEIKAGKRPQGPASGSRASEEEIDFGIGEQRAKEIMSDIFSGLEHVHRLGIVHHDIKPENILVNQDARFVMIADYGIAKYVGKEGRGKFSDGMRKSLFEDSAHCGTVGYLAPEKILYEKTKSLDHLEDNGEPVGSKVDIWAATVVTFLVLSSLGAWPFSGRPGHQDGRYSDNTLHGKVDYTKLPKKYQQGDVYEFLRKGFEQNNKKRPSAQSMLNHTWLITTKQERDAWVIKEDIGGDGGKKGRRGTTAASEASRSGISLVSMGLRRKKSKSSGGDSESGSKSREGNDSTSARTSNAESPISHIVPKLRKRISSAAGHLRAPSDESSTATNPESRERPENPRQDSASTFHSARSSNKKSSIASKEQLVPIAEGSSASDSLRRDTIENNERPPERRKWTPFGRHSKPKPVTGPIRQSKKEKEKGKKKEKGRPTSSQEPGLSESKRVVWSSTEPRHPSHAESGSKPASSPRVSPKSMPWANSTVPDMPSLPPGATAKHEGHDNTPSHSRFKTVKHETSGHGSKALNVGSRSRAEPAGKQSDILRHEPKRRDRTPKLQLKIPGDNRSSIAKHSRRVETREDEAKNASGNLERGTDGDRGRDETPPRPRPQGDGAGVSPMNTRTLPPRTREEDQEEDPRLRGRKQESAQLQAQTPRTHSEEQYLIRQASGRDGENSKRWRLWSKKS